MHNFGAISTILSECCGICIMLSLLTYILKYICCVIEIYMQCVAFVCSCEGFEDKIADST